ncbi:MAG: GDCCVxC domain-containing (seleno)protein [Gemmatimonadaceae bacterium]
MTLPNNPQLESTIQCPRCDGVRKERVPVDACQFFYECTHCGEILRPRSGDCCVFCSYGTAPCPSHSVTQREG